MSAQEPRVSVIVPVYNAAAYLTAGVEALLDQTCSDFELILVDDGSPDDSPALCDALAARDERIRVIHQQNAGAGRRATPGSMPRGGTISCSPTRTISVCRR